MTVGNSNPEKSIVFIHGSGCNSAIWAYQSRYFSRKYRVVALDLPGHGQDGRETLKSVGEIADFVLSEIERLKLHSPVVAGHSLGGAVALQLALNAQERLSAVALVGTGARLRVLPSLLESILSDYGAALGTLASCSYSSSTPKATIEKAVSEMKKIPAQVLYDDMVACDRFDVMQRLGEIHLPALVVVGRDDFMTPLKYSAYLRANLRRARLEVIDGAGHMVMIEQPERFNTVLDTFLRTTLSH